MVMRFLRMVTEIGTSESPQGRLYEANLLRATSSAFAPRWLPPLCRFAVVREVKAVGPSVTPRVSPRLDRTNKGLSAA